MGSMMQPDAARGSMKLPDVAIGSMMQPWAASGSIMWAPAHLVDLLILKLSTREISIVHVTEKENMEANVRWNTHHNDYLVGLSSALSIVPNTEASTFDEILGLLRSYHRQRINLQLPMAMNIHINMPLLQGVWQKCLRKLDACLMSKQYQLAFSSLADVVY